MSRSISSLARHQSVFSIFRQFPQHACLFESFGTLSQETSSHDISTRGDSTPASLPSTSSGTDNSSIGPRGVPRYDFLNHFDRHKSLTHFSRPDLRGPMVYTNWVNYWPMSKRDWSFLKKYHGNEQVPVEASRGGGDYRDLYAPQWRKEEANERQGASPSSFEAGRVISFGTLIDHITGSESAPVDDLKTERLYLAQQEVASVAPFLLPYIRAPAPHRPLDRFFGQNTYRVNVWAGPRGTTTPAHRDPYPNLLCQVFGRKEIVLFQPSAGASLLRPFDSVAHPHLRNTSRLNLEDPAILQRHPELANATWHHVILRPGEALYIPRHWWHFVRALDPSLSFNLWFQNRFLDKNIRAKRS